MSSNTLDGKGLAQASSLAGAQTPFWMDANDFQRSTVGPNIAISGNIRAEDNTPRSLAVNAGTGAVYMWDTRTNATPMVVVLGVVTPVSSDHQLLSGEEVDRATAHSTQTFSEALELLGMSRTGEQADLSSLVDRVSPTAGPEFAQA